LFGKVAFVICINCGREWAEIACVEVPMSRGLIGVRQLIKLGLDAEFLSLCIGLGLSVALCFEHLKALGYMINHIAQNLHSGCG
jgi:hypothetical protein